MKLVNNRRKIRQDSTRAQKKQITRKNILDAARKLFREKGFFEARTSEIARIAGVSHGTIFAHFESKGGILTTLHQEKLVRFFKAANQTEFSGETACAQLMNTILFYWDQEMKESDMTSAFSSYSWVWDGEYEKTYQQLMKDIRQTPMLYLRRAAENGELQDGLDHEQIINMIQFLYYGCLREARFSQEMAETSRKKLESMLKNLLQSISAKDLAL